MTTATAPTFSEQRAAELNRDLAVLPRAELRQATEDWERNYVHGTKVAYLDDEGIAIRVELDLRDNPVVVEVRVCDAGYFAEVFGVPVTHERAAEVVREIGQRPEGDLLRSTLEAAIARGEFEILHHGCDESPRRCWECRNTGRPQ